ncbi:MAG: histidine phosphotransferase [Rhodospirillaceae bacterium]|jgi:histidine phosphotransferase ChpT|nr:histidine phosphotransferase [Rhodospirillaceae bacterium]|tara:strand:+ start:575 stop:1213 length:639 start_codon:yes stop_codon:yes gene_type:complete
MVEDIHQRVTELLCSKICHDLISPVGAINNGIELLTDLTSGMQEDAVSLIGDSSRQVASRLAYFRHAFGGWGDGAAAEFGTIRRLVESHSNDNRMDLSWRQKPDDGDVVEKHAGKILLNLVLLAGECARRSATLEIAFAAPLDNLKLEIKLTGDRCALHPETRTGFDQDLGAEDLTVRNVVAFYSGQIAQANRLVLKYSDESPDSIEFNVTE